MISYEYLNNGEVLFVTYNGPVTKLILSSFLTFLFKETDVSKLKNILADYRKAQIDFTGKEVTELIQHRIQLVKKANITHSNITSIFLVNSPKETAIIVLFSMALRNKALSFIYSTNDPCLQKLSLDLTPKELDLKLNNLKYSYQHKN
ncbi:hypothetical protein FHR24_002845 [Wenyingzhuangia heitensis]|uniref:Uncharacterized protein n=1 Tax=Wenyingzhuangia heitensis TaxID=1487859 RepID=A0ABX0UCA0_9FLAO|nr:hypothetical protein [Wenyingzhuangia heitensis]NIJ46358.1 hypothetical protein [Wenyingzhuangia heitensis]